MSDEESKSSVTKISDEEDKSSVTKNSDEESKSSVTKNSDEEYKSSVTKNSYLPYILPEWKNDDGSENPEPEESKIIQLTDENAHNYTKMSSHVGWKKRVDHALKQIETNNVQQCCIINGLLENAISTVVVLATGGTAPDEFLINTYLYLRYIRNEFGENPPNIAVFIKFLKTKASPEVLSMMKIIDESNKDKIPTNLTITRIPKDFQVKTSNQ